MKKFFIFCLMAFALCSCDKSDVLENPMVTISFNQQMVTGLPMTKGETNDFLNIIAEQTPTYVNVTLKNLDLDKTFTCKSNESITIPIGNYEISGYVNGTYTYNMMYRTPSLKCDKFIFNVNTSTNIITLNTHYNCFAIFALIDECYKCEYTAAGGNDFYKYNKYYVGYFQNNGNEVSGTTAEVKLTPYDDSNEFISTTYTFSTTYDVNKVYAEYGKYYVIHPQQVSKTTSSFIMELPNMVEGKI